MGIRVGNKVGNVDWDNPGLGTRRDDDVCVAYGKFTIAMEKVKGGVLADPINMVKENNSMFNVPWVLFYVHKDVE